VALWINDGLELEEIQYANSDLYVHAILTPDS